MEKRMSLFFILSQFRVAFEQVIVSFRINYLIRSFWLLQTKLLSYPVSHMKKITD